MSRPIWSLSELAVELDVSRQMLWKRTRYGHVPAPAYVSRRGTPYWSEAQVRRIISTWVPNLREES